MSFNGTSSASAIVAGAAAVIQSLSETNFGERFPPRNLRQLLIDTGIPQGIRVQGHIGPMVDLGKALLWMGLGSDADGNNVPDECQAPDPTPDVNRNAIPDLCEPVLSVGPRYLSISPTLDPNLGTDPIALRIVGDSADVACVSSFVQAPDKNLRATLGPSPVCRTPADWGTVYVYDETIVPTSDTANRTFYHVEAVVQSPSACVDVPGQMLGTVPVDSWLWGDTFRDDTVFFDDFQCVEQATMGNYAFCGFYAADLMGCEPNRIVNSADLAAVVDALQGGSYYGMCPGPCSQPYTTECISFSEKST
jgi:hypothetical protein